MAASFLPRFTRTAIGSARQIVRRARETIRTHPELSRWIYPESVADDDRRESNRRAFSHLVAHERMLADRTRLDFYRAVIDRHVRPGKRVLDLGTGTGILAAWAAQRGASKVYAIDHADIVEVARSLGAANGLTSQIEYVATHSRDFRLAEPVDVILHEQMGDCLFEESMVANLTDARDRLLRPGGVILPARFEFHIEPVQLRDEHRTPFAWELELHGYDLSSLRAHRPENRGHYYLVSAQTDLVERFVADTGPAMSFDLGTLDPSRLAKSLSLKRAITHAGRIDGYAVYFRTRVDDDLVLSTAPLDAKRASSWPTWILRTEAVDVQPGDRIEFDLTLGRWSDVDSWRWTSRVGRSV